ncbi:MAG: TerB N-terminal domain-containing protein [Oscillospiraceae bacterium]|nr:TerB N-terminal domain-containing protein [Oscillospiraceae bacterium]
MSRETDQKRAGSQAAGVHRGLESLADIMRQLRQELTAVTDPLFPELELQREDDCPRPAADAELQAGARVPQTAGAAARSELPLMTGRELLSRTLRAQPVPDQAAVVPPSDPAAASAPPSAPDPFAEIVLPARPGSGGSLTAQPAVAAPRQQPLAPPDPAQARFIAMRRLAQRPGLRQLSSERYLRWQEELFGRQALFMADFDLNQPWSVRDLDGITRPHYQAMTELQLRAYFNWRSQLRRGGTPPAALPALYIYSNELLNLAGTKGPQDSLQRLLALWQAYRGKLPGLDPVLGGWVRDFYITHDFRSVYADFPAVLAPWPELLALYQSAAEPLCDFSRLVNFSDYKISRSAFYTAENAGAMAACFDALCTRLDQRLRSRGASLARLLYYETDEYWQPFAQAFCSPSTWRQDDCRVVYSEAETYYQVRQRWHKAAYKALLPASRGLIGYMLKQLEIYCRRQAKYKHQLKPPAREPARLDFSGLPEPARSLKPEQVFAWIDEDIAAAYRQTHRIKIQVRPDQLQTIRFKAKRIQDRLLADLGETAAPAAAPAAVEPPVAPAAPAAASAAVEPPAAPAAAPAAVEPPVAPAAPAAAPAAVEPPAAPAAAPAAVEPPAAPAAAPAAVELPAAPAAAPAAVELPAAPAAAPAAVELPAAPAAAPAAVELPAAPAAAPAAVEPPAPPAAATPWTRLLSQLTALEQTALRLALEHPSQAAFQSWCHTSGCLPEVLLDHINEAALDCLQDSLLELNDQLSCYEDYEPELRQALAEAAAAAAPAQER